MVIKGKREIVHARQPWGPGYRFVEKVKIRNSLIEAPCIFTKNLGNRALQRESPTIEEIAGVLGMTHPKMKGEREYVRGIGAKSRLQVQQHLSKKKLVANKRSEH